MISREVLWLSCNLHVVFFIIIIIILPILKSNSNIKVCINRNKQNEKHLTVSLRIYSGEETQEILTVGILNTS